jgi:hypothetical protein
MTTTHHVSRAALALTAAAALGAAPAGAADDARAGLLSLAGRRVYFAHQSVGANVLEGLGLLAAASGVPLRIAETRDAGGVPTGTFAHGLIGENGNPRLKLEAFEQALTSGPARDVDIRADTDAAALFAAYQATLDRLRARRPEVTFVHVTVPLTRLPGGLKASLKRLLGRPSQELLENARRDEYNTLLRRAYAGKQPIFDLARVEAERPDGAAEAADWKGRAVPALAAEYTDDGGHLNRLGQARAARELVAVLGAIPRQGAPPVGSAP